MTKIITLILMLSTAIYANTDKKEIDIKINLILAKKSEFFVGSVLQNIKGSFLVMDNKKEVMDKILNRDNGAPGSDLSQMQDFLKICSPKERKEYQKLRSQFMKKAYYGSKNEREQAAFIKFTEEIKKKYSRSYKVIYITGAKKDLVDGEQWIGPIWRIGTFKYTSTNGAGRTVAKYTADPKVAAKHFKIAD